MLISLHPRFAAHRFAGPAITAGGAVFSGSIFALVLARDKCVPISCGRPAIILILLLRFKWLGPATPLGGSLMILGWVHIPSPLSCSILTKHSACPQIPLACILTVGGRERFLRRVLCAGLCSVHGLILFSAVYFSVRSG